MAVPIVTWEQYAADWSGLHGGVDLGKVRPGVRRWLRLGFVVARWLQRVRVPAGAVTALGLMSSVVVVVVVTHGSGGILLAALLVFLATLADTVDGALAILSGHTTRLGYVYDAVVDRIGEACWLIALWRIGAAGHVVVAAGALAWLHEYVRSRGNAAGMTEITAVTVGERPTRVMVTIGGLVLAGFAESFNPRIAAGIAAITTATWIVLGLIGITQLLAAVHRALAGQSWPTWRRAATPSVTAPPAPVPPSVRPATPTYAGPTGAAERPGVGFNERSGDRSYQRGDTGPAERPGVGFNERSGDRSYQRGDTGAVERRTPDRPSDGTTGDRPDVGAGGRDVHDNGISEVVSYAAPSADQPSEPSPDLALSEPTLDDLLGDAGARVRSAVEKYGRSVTVYRSQVAGTSDADAADTTDTATTDTGAEAPGADTAGAGVMGTAAEAEARSVTETGTNDGGTGSDHINRNRSGSRGTHAEHATGKDGPLRAETGESTSGPSRASKIRAHSRARIRFSRRSRAGTAKSTADESGQASRPATSAGSDHNGDG